jgi:hypothetical protein
VIGKRGSFRLIPGVRAESVDLSDVGSNRFQISNGVDWLDVPEDFLDTDARSSQEREEVISAAEARIRGMMN